MFVWCRRPCTAVHAMARTPSHACCPCRNPVSSRRTASRPARDPVGIKAAQMTRGGTALPQIMARRTRTDQLALLSRAGVPIRLSPSPLGAAFAAAEA
jgi:hypothetical protein